MKGNPMVSPDARKDGRSLFYRYYKLQFAERRMMDLDVEALEKAESQIDRLIEKRGSEEQRRVEEFWEASRQSHEETRRRQSCVEWIHHHEHLADVFRSHADRHARQQERYSQILQTMFTNEGAA